MRTCCTVPGFFFLRHDLWGLPCNARMQHSACSGHGWGRLPLHARMLHTLFDQVASLPGMLASRKGCLLQGRALTDGIECGW
jgi:hypothetical protein